MRLQEFSSLLAWEIPPLPRARAEVPIPFPVPAGVAKGRYLDVSVIPTRA